MKNDVKTLVFHDFSGERNRQAKFQVFWAVYLALSTLFLGLFVCAFMLIPLALLGKVVRQSWRLAGLRLISGVRLLLKVQPWLHCDVVINVPSREGPTSFITVSNHRSHLDMFILLSSIQNVRAVAKSSLFSIPFLGIMLRVLKMISVKSNDTESYINAMKTAHAAVTKEGDPVHIFPEGTRCPLGNKGVLDFHLSPFRMACFAKVPVIPVVFIGTDGVWPKGRFGICYGAPVIVRSLEPLDPIHHPQFFTTASELRGEVRRRIESELARHGS